MFTRYTLVLLAILFCLTTCLLDAQQNKIKSTYNVDPNLEITFATPPTVVTNPATVIDAFSAVLNGTVNPQGKSTNARFQWGLTSSYGNLTTSVNVGSGTTNNVLSTPITSLIPNTQYHFRITATNTDGTSNGIDRVFTTASVPAPLVRSIPASDVGQTFATLNGEANPNGYSTDAWFTWGSDSLINVTSPISLGSDTFFVPFTSTLTDLLPNTTYQYFANAQSVGGLSTTATTMIFTTLSSPNEYMPDGNTVGLYHLNDAKEFIQDYSGQENHGVIDTVTGTSSPAIIPGKYGNARDFSYFTQEITIFPNSSLEFTDEDFTLEAWVNPEFYGLGDVVIIGHGSLTDTSLAFQLRINPFYQLEVNLSGDGTLQSQTVTLSAPVVTNTWQHVAAVIDMVNFEVRIFHNGVLQPTSSSGAFPTILHISPTPITIGSFAGVAKTFAGLSHCSIDEVRISNIGRQPFEFKIPGTISGVKFWDRVNPGYYDESAGDTVLGNWGIVLQQLPSNDEISYTFEPETTYTDQFGFYTFTELNYGTYMISEILQEGWLQTYPAGDGKHTLTIYDGTAQTNINFGNVDGYEFDGPDGGSWSDPTNWEGNQTPGNNTPVYFDSVEIVFDVPFDDSIGALRIGPGGTLTFDITATSTLGSGGGSLYIEDKLTIDNDATINGGFGNVWLYCDGDFQNQGTFNAGNSK
ncbi:MAG: hypothetical protein HYZ34_04645, partial [Ignavibacteriae bacterium]|nr:hypothetical protein [Ignavibacteriota bacterium]